MRRTITVCPVDDECSAYCIIRSHNIRECSTMFSNVHLRWKIVKQKACCRIVSSNLTPSAPQFVLVIQLMLNRTLSIPDCRFCEEQNVPLPERKQFRESLRKRHPTNNAPRCIRETIRSGLELPCRQDQFATLPKIKPRKRQSMPQHDQTGRSDICC